MEGRIFDDIENRGNVKIELVNSTTNKTYRTIKGHNTATINMCSLVASALIGEDISAKVPGFIVPTIKENDTYRNMFSFGVPTLEDTKKLPVDETRSYVIVECTFLIENTLLSTGKQIDGFRLLGLNKVNYTRPVLAEIKLQEQGISPIKISNSKTNLKVTWDLIISYSPTIEEEV